MPVCHRPVGTQERSAIASHVLAQLQQGADFADRVAPPDTICRPVLIRGRKINLHKLNREKVRFRGFQLTIRVGRCKNLNNLVGALSEDRLTDVDFLITDTFTESQS